MGKVDLLSLKEKDVWTDFLKNIPAEIQDVYYTPEYYEIYEKYGDGRALCFVFQDGNNLALYPFLINLINNLGYNLEREFFDIQGAYGYNGVLASSTDLGFRKKFYNEFEEFCKNEFIIAEFTRFNPLLKNQEFSREYLNVIYNRCTVYIDLTKDYSELYMNYDRSVRRNIQKAKQNNLEVHIYKEEFSYKNEFVQMYNETMKRVNADNYYYFNEDYFENVFNNLPLLQFVVFYNKVPIASSLCLYSMSFLNILFIVSESEYLFLRPNDLLIDEIVRYGIENGHMKINFGGGSTNLKEDSLLRFKKNFSNEICDFFIGGKIYEYNIYHEICEQWRVKNPECVEKYNDRILKYRKGKMPVLLTSQLL